MHSPRLTIALGVVMMASILGAPSVSAFSEAVNTGTTTDYNVTDEAAAPGVVCSYEDHAGLQNDELDRIRVRALDAHAPFARKSHVGYRFIVKRQVPPFSGPYKTVFRSPIIKKKANLAEVAFFPARTWTAPEGTAARYRVHVYLFWYAKGSTQNVIGRVRGLMEAYRHKLADSGNAYVNGDVGSAGWCHPNFNVL